jgi:hypothetical protein
MMLGWEGGDFYLSEGKNINALRYVVPVIFIGVIFSERICKLCELMEY